MSEKRYAIVRVDKKDCGNCEFAYKGKNGKVACKIGGIWQCDNYGDTKEQLIAKVNQILQKAYEERTGNYGYSLKFYEPIARKIVEFLGVEQ